DSRAQASSLYYFGYYAGSSLFGWALGIVFGQVDWVWFIVAILAMCGLAAGSAVAKLRRSPEGGPS
ncbi:MFS transporter, partial [Pseudomonas sp. BGM005]|nr:MFS transporter [Pseudomonas sp. BG5]